MPTPDDFELPVINPTPKKLYGRCQRGNLPPNPPRKQKGQVAKITRDIKNGVLTAAENLGRDGNGAGGFIGYCEFLGWYHPKAFAHLLGKMLPLNLNANIAGPTITAVNIVSVPSDTYLSHDDIERLRDGRTPTIEHVPQEIAPASVPEPAPASSASQLAALEAWLATMPEEKLSALAGIVGAGAD